MSASKSYEINILDKEDIDFISQSKILELHGKEPKHWLSSFGYLMVVIIVYFV